MGAGLLPDKEQHWRMNIGSLLKIESINFWGYEVMVYVISWRRSSRVQSLAQE
jgi:hypothetical protein